jgi:Mannosyl-glycoprotein endo-beta-N-acetylglucosaminidase
LRKLISTGFVFLAGVVSAPIGASRHDIPRTPAPAYRADPRLEALRHFFEKFNCPAIDYSLAFLEAADDYDLDWRLLPSISYVESTGGKSARNNNLFGWDSGHAQFTSPTAGIHEVGYRLAYSDLYRDKDLDGILATYNPDAEYAEKVKSVMQRISRIE